MYSSFHKFLNSIFVTILACGISWHSAISLKKHVAQIHGQIVTICDICGKIVKSKSILERHKQQVHENFRPFKCNYCEESFKNHNSLACHIGEKHDSSVKKFKCDKCDFSTAYHKSLRQHHQDRHEKNRQFPCHICPYVSVRKETLRTHIRQVHEGYRPYKCKFCPKGYTCLRELRKHIEVHHKNC